ncbi:MAG: Clp protease N-terminal domain-containing protein [Ktedonobacteraceae bacterium]
MRDVLILGIAAYSLIGIAFVVDILAQYKIIPRRFAPGAARDLFFSRFGLWCRTVVPAFFALIGLIWLLLHFVLPQDIQALRSIYSMGWPIALGIMALAFIGYKKSYPYIDDEKAKESGEILGIKTTKTGEHFCLPDEPFSFETVVTWMRAQGETRKLKQREIDTGELLVALLEEEKSIACKLLEKSGANLKTARIALKDEIGYGDKPHKIDRLIGRVSLTERPLSAQAQLSAKKAVEWAKNLEQSEIRNEHLLLGLLDTEDSVALRLLKRLQISPDSLRQTLLSQLPR